MKLLHQIGSLFLIFTVLAIIAESKWHKKPKGPKEHHCKGGEEKKGHKHHEELRRKVETLTGQMKDMQRENRDLKSEIDKMKWTEKNKDREMTKVSESSNIICEYESHTIQCGENGFIKITHAAYGRTSSFEETPQCAANGPRRTDCVSSDSLQRLQSKCDGEQICRITANNAFFDDPCFHTTKYLNVTFACYMTTHEEDPQQSENIDENIGCYDNEDTAGCQGNKQQCGGDTHIHYDFSETIHYNGNMP